MLSWPRTGLLDNDGWGDDPDEKNLAQLISFDLKTAKKVTMADAVRGYQVCVEQALLHSADGLRIQKAGEEEPDDAPEGFSPQSGCIRSRPRPHRDRSRGRVASDVR